MADHRTDVYRTGKPYVVVSADTHASPDDFDHFLSYVDPAHREAVDALGELASTAISMFGGSDAGEVDESDPVRAVAARRLAGMGVDIGAAKDWLANYSTDWVHAGDAQGQRLSVLEEQGVHAECDGPRGEQVRRSRTRVARAARVQPMARRLLCSCAGPPRRVYPDGSARHGSSDR
jgi:hypothetical protein